MKGFGIEIKNNLLDPKHIENMGPAVWFYMWLIDKMTSISEEGVGLVLGGRPVKFEEVKKELGISQNTYTRWIDRLLKYPYIMATLTPYGYVYKVLKAKKRFTTIQKRFTNNSEPTGSPQTGNVIKTLHYNTKDRASSLKKSAIYKPTGEQMRFSKGKWWVLPKNGGQWLEFADKKETIVYV